MLEVTLLLLLGLALASDDSHKILVSYVFHIPVNYQLLMHEHVYSQCRANIDTFLERGVAASTTVDFVFVRMGRSLVPESLSQAVDGLSNVHLEDFPNSDAVMQAHAAAMEKRIGSKDYFVLLSCAARGPYDSSIRLASTKGAPKQRAPVPTTDWIGSMTSRLSGPIKAAGATVSCEGRPHIQGYAMALTREAAQLLLGLWRPGTASTSSGSSLELEGSQLLLGRGMGITSFDARYRGANFHSGEVCPRLPSTLGHLLNPTACYSGENSLGCSGVDPCEVVFVKYGDDVLRNGLIPPATKQRVAEEDGRVVEDNICPELLGTIRPDWNISMISERVLPLRENEGLRTARLRGLVILIRAHSGYLGNLNMMLEFIATLPNAADTSVIVLPTEFAAYEQLREVSLRNADKVHNHLIYIPKEIYTEFEPYLASICTDEYSRHMNRRGRGGAIPRYCGINSPVHYLLVDIALHAVKSSSSAGSKLVVTNADNFYSPRFFNYVFKHSGADVFMVNMVSKGRIFDTKPVIGQVDLGAYATSLDFLKKHDVYFLNSLPPRVLPHDYHDADGHFLRSIITKGGNLVKTAEYLFFHN